MPVVTPGKVAPKRKDELPPGPYLVRIEDVERILHGSGKTRVDFVYLVIAGEFTGRKMFDHCYETKDALWRLQRVAEVAGVTEAFNTEDPADLINKFVGKSLKVKTKADNYTNRDGVLVEGRKIIDYRPATLAPAPTSIDRPHEDGAPPPGDGDAPPRREGDQPPFGAPADT